MTAGTVRSGSSSSSPSSWPKMTFALDDAPANSPRSGGLSFTRSESEVRCISTPAVMAYTRKGAIPHLTRDNVARLPNEMVHLSLEHFLDISPPIFTRAPMSLHRFIGLYETPTYRQPILALGLRDTSSDKPLAPNQDKLIMAATLQGSAKISSGAVCDYLLAQPTDIVIAPSDEQRGSLSSKKLDKVIRRGLQWASDFIAKADGRANVFVPLVGGQSPIGRSEFSNALLGDTPNQASQPAKVEPGRKPLDASINGYVLTIDSTLPGLHELCHASLDPLPSHKPRLALGVSGPHAILKTIQEIGLDIFVDEWSSQISTVGVALDFSFPVPHEADTLGHDREHQRPIGLDLYDPAYDRSFIPLSSSILAPSPEALHAFGPIPPTRAYVHHLLQAREMTSYVILAQHNLTVMHRFFQNIRDVLRRGKEEFDLQVQRFNDTYEDQQVPEYRGRGYAVVMNATREFDRVNKERGKGSLRDKLAKDAVTLAEGVATKMTPLPSPAVPGVVEVNGGSKRQKVA
ncbi:BQ5605_C019g09028 [Microbotryum silenes-dioicae]|uniref:BQ5605_C019g09028 protein n=1 Tax=Microbotryum silenes-dioicae TaxID=796604 RepID=A0A2X0NU83_9BASI|nr:BQ5605_C019g09028 [Microbotryum silenes-dioicae]